MAEKLSMSELIVKHNELADALGIAQETSFKNLAAARAAVANLENKMNATTTPDAPFDGGTEVTETVEVATGDRAKYNSSGKRGPTQGVGEYAKQCILDGMDNATALAAVLDKFPSAKTSKSCIAYYRTALSKGPAAKKGQSPEDLRAKAQELLAKATALEEAKATIEAAAAAVPAETVDA